MKVIFSVLKSSVDDDLISYVVSYVIDNYSTDTTIAIVADKEIAALIDDALWMEGKNSFIPHFCAINTSDYNQYKRVPVFITDNVFVADGRDVVINITNSPINIVRHKFNSVIEVVDQNEKRLDSSRKKYMYYKKLNADVIHEKVGEYEL